MFQWRKFGFFEKETLATEGSNADEKSGDFGGLKVFQSGEGDITASASGRGKLFFGSSLGNIVILDRSINRKIFQAHEKQVISLCRLKKQDILVSVGLDDDVYASSIKIWKLHNMDTPDQLPQLAKSIKPFDQKFPEAPIMCFCVTEDLSQIVLGLGDGGIILIEGDLIRNKGKTQRYIQRSGPCITGLHIIEESHESNFRTFCFVTTSSNVFSMITSAKSIKPTVIDPDEGCDVNCSTLTDNKMLVVARSLAVFLFMRTDRGSAYSFDEPKKIVRWFNNYLILVCDDRKTPGKNSINIYDLNNQLIAFTAKFDNVIDVITEWASLFVVTSSGIVHF